jgi:hypothetical protein
MIMREKASRSAGEGTSQIEYIAIGLIEVDSPRCIELKKKPGLGEFSISS